MIYSFVSFSPFLKYFKLKPLDQPKGKHCKYNKIYLTFLTPDITCNRNVLSNPFSLYGKYKSINYINYFLLNSFAILTRSDGVLINLNKSLALQFTHWFPTSILLFWILSILIISEWKIRYIYIFRYTFVNYWHFLFLENFKLFKKLY